MSQLADKSLEFMRLTSKLQTGIIGGNGVKFREYSLRGYSFDQHK